MESLTTIDSRPVRRKFSKPPVKVACLSWYAPSTLYWASPAKRIDRLTYNSRTLRIRCDGQNPCMNCVGKNASCFYVPSRRGGPRNCQNRKRRREPALIPVSITTVPGADPTVQENDRSDTHTTDTEERRSQQSSLSGSGFSSGIGSDDADWFHQLMDLSEPGAGLRNVEMPIAEIESIFESIFAGEQGGTDIPDANVHFPMADLVQIYGSYGDMYVGISACLMGQDANGLVSTPITSSSTHTIPCFRHPNAFPCITVHCARNRRSTHPVHSVSPSQPY